MSKTPNQVIQNLENVLASLKTKTGKSQNNLTDVVGAMATNGRAETTLVSTVNSNELVFTAKNEQKEGYVYKAADTKDIKTATVTLSVDGPTVTASHGDNKISETVESGSVAAIATVNSPSITLTPSTIGLTNKTAAVTGKTQVSATPSTNSNGVAKYYVAVEANTSATNSSKSITATANANIGKDGYLYTTDSKNTTASGTASATIAATVTTHYIPLASGSYSVSGGDLSGAGVLTPTISFTNDTMPEGISIGTNDNNYDRHFKITATSSTGSKTITRAAVTSNIGTAGYIDSTTDKPGIEQAQATVTVNQGSGDTYVNMNNASYTVSGGDLTDAQEFTPTLTLSNGNENNMGNNATISTTKDTTNYPYWFKVTAISSTTTKSVTRAAVTATQSAGYLSSTATAQQKIGSATTTVEVKQGTGNSYVGVKAGEYHPAGGTVTAGDGSASASVTATGITLGTASTTAPSTPYLKVEGSGKVSFSAVTATQSAGYIPALAATQARELISAKNNQTSNTATVYYPITGVGRADTTIEVTANSTDKTLTVTATNDQLQGYQAGGSKTATATVTLSVSGNVVTASHDTSTISATVDTGALIATGAAATTTSINPGTLTVTTATAGNPIAQAGTATTTQPNSGNYISLNANIASANATPITFNGTATADIKTNGYVTSSQKVTETTGVTATANVGVNSASATYYIPISEASYSPQLTMTPGNTNINASSSDIAFGTAATTAPNGPYVAVQASGSVSAESVATITSAGYAGVGSSSTSNTISSVDSTVYYPITACSPATSFNGVYDERNLYLTSTCTLGSKGFYQSAALTRTFAVTPYVGLEFDEESKAFISTSDVYWTGDDGENSYNKLFSKSFDAVALSNNTLKPEHIRKGFKIFGVVGTFGSNAGASLKIRSATTYPTIDKIKVIYWEYVYGTPTQASVEFIPINTGDDLSEWVYIDNIVIDTTFEVMLYGERMNGLAIMGEIYTGIVKQTGGTEGRDENGQYYESNIYKLTDTNAELTIYTVS